MVSSIITLDSMALSLIYALLDFDVFVRQAPTRSIPFDRRHRSSAVDSCYAIFPGAFCVYCAIAYILVGYPYFSAFVTLLHVLREGVFCCFT